MGFFRRNRGQFREARAWLDVSIIGIQFPIAMALGFFWGRWLDGVFGTGRWLTLIFSFFGIAAGFINLFRITMEATREEERKQGLEDEKEGSGPDGA